MPSIYIYWGTLKQNIYNTNSTFKMKGSNLILLTLSLCGSFFCTNLVNGESYIPKYVEGNPIEGRILTIDPPDLRKEDLYRIDHKVEQSSKDVADAMVHRTYSEFATLDHKLRSDFFISNPPLDLPAKSDKSSVDDLNNYFTALYTEKSIRESNIFTDFLSINWDGSDISFLYDLSGFLDMLLIQRVPHFMPEPPKIEMDAFMHAETPFERYVYFLAFKHDHSATQEYLEFFNDYCETTPTWTGPNGDNTDVLHPGYEGIPFDYPYHYDLTYVHFLPKGYLNGQTVRISYLGNSKFSFLNETILNTWFRKLYFEETQIEAPKVILDVGTGTGGSAFVLGEIFPEANVTGIDMADPYIRFTRAAKDLRNAPNVEFYQGNAEDLFYIESDSVDFLNFAYVMHEMPKENAKLVAQEMYRVLKPGGILNGFEVPFVSNPISREVYILFQTWGNDWQVQGNQGPEPYMSEYENGVQLPRMLEDIGFKNVNEREYSYFESVFTATK